MQSLNAGFNDGSGYVTIHRIEATNDGVIDLSAVQTVQGAVRGEDRLEFAVNTGGSIDLSGLQSMTSGYTKFDLALDPGTPFSLAALESAVKTSFTLASGTTANLNALLSQDGGTYDIADGATVNAAAWTSANGVTLNVEAGGTLSAPNLTTFTSSVLHRQPGQILTLPGFTNIDNSKLSVSGGEALTVAATSYSSTALTASNRTHTLLSASGTDGGATASRLDLSSLTSLNAGFYEGSGYVTIHRIEATNDGVIDLSAVQTVQGAVRGEDRLEFAVNTGGSIDLSGLQSMTSGYTKFDLALDPGTPFSLAALESAVKTSFTLASGTTANLNALLSQDGGTYDIADGATVNAAAWTSANGVTLNVEAGGTLSAPNLTTFTSSVLHRQPGQILTLPGFTNIDNSKLSVSGGEALTVAATSYSSTALTASNRTHTLLSASGTDGGATASRLDLSSLTSLNAGFYEGSGYVTIHRVEAIDGGQVDLSGVHSAVGPIRGEDRLDFVVSNGGQMSFGFSSLSQNVNVDVADIASTLAVDGHLSLASTTTIGVTDAARMELAGSFSFHHSEESNINLDAGILDFVGGGTRFLEVGGEDLGLPAGGMTGNFGIGQLVVGSDATATTVVLLDAVDNLNRGTVGEALYLLGLGGPDGLRILNASTLYIGDINVYTTELGSWVHINSLFPPEETIIAYDDGFISIGDGPVKAGDANLDGLVDGGDYTLWADNYQRPADWMSGDFTRDAWVDGGDYTIWADNYAPGGGAAVPEPGGVALLVCGGLISIRRRLRPRGRGKRRL